MQPRYSWDKDEQDIQRKPKHRRLSEDTLQVMNNQRLDRTAWSWSQTRKKFNGAVVTRSYKTLLQEADAKKKTTGPIPNQTLHLLRHGGRGRELWSRCINAQGPNRAYSVP